MALRVLVVDNYPEAAKTLAMLLRLWGHEPHLAFDGESAIEAAKALQPDVVLLDLRMPRTSGFEVAQRLRQLMGSTFLLVAVTGLSNGEFHQKALDGGFDHFFVKGAPMDRLQMLLDRRAVPCS
jgi:CheY-like chemotaxis protein